MLETKQFSEIKTIFHKPYLLGVTLAFFIVAGIWPGGFDASQYYLRYLPENATVPAWIYLITYPISLVGWPMSWQILVVLTVLTASLVYAMRGNQNWWLVIASSAFIYNAWWGQIEIFSIIGLALCMLVLGKKISPFWLGIAWLLMVIKPQVNYGLIILFIWWIWRNQGIKVLVLASISFLLVILITFLLFPGWLGRLINTLLTLQSGDANAAVWPWGLGAWLIALIPLKVKSDIRMRMVAASTLLGSPYFTLHHCTSLLVLTDHPYGLMLSWLPIIMITSTRDWARYAWIIPVGILAIDLLRVAVKFKRNGFLNNDCQ